VPGVGDFAYGLRSRDLHFVEENRMPTTFQKRQKEMKRTEKRKMKEEKRAQRKQEKLAQKESGQTGPEVATIAAEDTQQQ
jgi:hypothetical protein